MGNQDETVLARLRRYRGFCPERYVAAKTRLFNDYLRGSGLSALVIGVSGGVDSALTLAIAARAAQEPNSPIKKIIAALLPYYISAGTTGQSEATSRGEEVVRAVQAGYKGGAVIESRLVDLSEPFKSMKQTVDSAFEQEGDDWAAGQLVSYLRTPALFYLTSLLTQQGFPALLVGTTNRDEGGYIGYFGKAADAMVDLQLISDLHKSEVYSASAHLGVPQSVLDVAPTGDIYDGRNDEELIGVPYDYIELYSLLLSLPDSVERVQLEQMLRAGNNIEDCGLSQTSNKFAEYAARLDKLNRQNSHKYVSGSAAVHLDVMERAVPGGWRKDLDEAQLKSGMAGGKFVNIFQMPEGVLEKIRENTALSAQNISTDKSAKTYANQTKLTPLASFGESAFVVDDVFAKSECTDFTAVLDKLDWQPVGLNGMLKDYKPGDPIGSYRASLFNEDLAHCIFARLLLCKDFPRLRLMQDDTPADWDEAPVWRATAVNPLMRFIKYQEGGLLVPHYDAPFDYYDGKRTLMSLVLYLTEVDSTKGGATRFILDPQINLPLSERIYEDWDRLANPEEIITAVSPRAGAALILDHRVLHDGEALQAGANKIIMRTDVVFERCGLAPKRAPGVSKPLGMPERAGYDA